VTFLSAPQQTIHPRASASLIPIPTATPSPPGPRTLVANVPASPTALPTLDRLPKLPAAPSTSVAPLSAEKLLPKLRWANIGWSYHWGTKQYDFARPRVPVNGRVRDLCRDAVGAVPWGEVFAECSGDDEEWGDGGPDWDRWNETYEPDAGIVNFYQTKDTLMAHIDRSELCATSPLVSVSLGNAAVFLIGGQSRDTKPLPILLRSGDIVIMAGPQCRRAYHGVPRILEDTLPDHVRFSNDVSECDGDAWAPPYAEYMATARINVNVRQVFPKGFVPGTVNCR